MHFAKCRGPVWGAWLILLGALPAVSPISLRAQATAQQSQLSDLAVRAGLEARFQRVDEFQLSEGPAGAQGNFFISGDLKPRGQRGVATLQMNPDAAVAAVTTIADLLKVDLNEFTPRKVRESTDDHGVAHRRYEVFLQGWRVERFELVTHVREDGTLIAANGHVVRFLPDQLAQIREGVDKATVTEAEAEATVLPALAGVRDGDPKLERVISPDSPYVFWVVVVSTRNPLGSWKYYVDAQSGLVRNRINLLQTVR